MVLHRQASELSPVIAAELAQSRQAVLTEVSGVVRTCSAEGVGPACAEDEADFVAYTLVGAADSLTDWMVLHPEEPPERITVRLMNMVWVGMRNVLDGEVWTTPAGEG